MDLVALVIPFTVGLVPVVTLEAVPEVAAARTPVVCGGVGVAVVPLLEKVTEELGIPVVPSALAAVVKLGGVPVVAVVNRTPVVAVVSLTPVAPVKLV